MAKKKISGTTVNLCLDSFLLVLFLVLSWSGIILRFIFPPGPDAAGWTLWGWGFDSWCGFVVAMICALGLGILLHVMLHWPWICGVVANKISKKKEGPMENPSRTLWGVGLLIVIFNLIGLGIAAAALMVQGPVE